MDRCPICEPESYYGAKSGPWIDGPVCDGCQAGLGTYALRVDRVCGQNYYFPLASNLLQCADHEKFFAPMLWVPPTMLLTGHLALCSSAPRLYRWVTPMPSFKAYIEIEVYVDYDLGEDDADINWVALGTVDLTDHLTHEEIQQIEEQLRDHEIARYEALESAQADRADDIRKYGRDG